ncbi:Pentatricopeptide repeat (PPR) superfamily protein [Euphorbia peplus]|nr:Pentatricopeptide repeat (PPR) superfamily protein [Euphorbia peplus]
MKNLIQSIFGHRRSVLRSLGCRNYGAVASEEYAKRNYANNLSEYNTVLGSLIAKRRPYLLRDMYDDMVLDGVQPSRDTFHSLIVGTMKGARLQDAFFFRDEMKKMGLVPDINLYNFLISTCGKCQNSDHAIKIMEEMKKYEVKPNGQTYICLLNAFAATARLDRVYAIIRDMTAAGAGLNKFCYAGLITAYMNQTPVPDDAPMKIIEFVEQSKGWSSIDSANYNAENMMMAVSEEELYNLPTAEYVNRRGGFMNRQFAVYHVASLALADLQNVQAMETLLEMLKKDDKFPDVYIWMQAIRCYLQSGDMDNGYRIFDVQRNSMRTPAIEIFSTFVEGAMIGYTPKGMQLAHDALVDMTSRNYNLTPKIGSELLFKAAGETTGDYTTANYIWDMMQAREITPSFPAVEAYHRGLMLREIPADDPRLKLVGETLSNLRSSGPWGRVTGFYNR